MPAQGAGAASQTEIKEVAKELVCLCGSCNRESLATCMCSEWAVPERENIGQLLDQGMDRQQVIDQYIENYGALVLALPPAEGYNLLAYIAPFVALIFGIAIVRSVLVNWRRKSEAAADPPAPPPEKTSDYNQRLRRDLDQYDDN